MKNAQKKIINQINQRRKSWIAEIIQIEKIKLMLLPKYVQTKPKRFYYYAQEDESQKDK